MIWSRAAAPAAALSLWIFIILQVSSSRGEMWTFGQQIEGESAAAGVLNRLGLTQQLRQQLRQRLAGFKAQIEFVHNLGDGDYADYDTSQPKNESEQVASDSARPSKMKRDVILATNVLPGRRRRNITSYIESGGSQIVKRIYRPQPQPFDSKTFADFSVLKVQSNYYIFSLEVLSDGAVSLIIYKIEKGLNPREIIRENTPGAVSLETVQIHGQHYVLVAKYKENNADPLDSGSQLYLIDFSGENLKKIQTLNTDFTQSIQFWVGAGDEANDIFLGVAPEYTDTPKGKLNRVHISVYRWQGGYFDLVNFIHTIPASNPQAISYANIYSHGYLAVANFQDDTKSTSVYSEIFKYNHRDSRFGSFQKILTHGAMDIQHFSLTSGSREEHFLGIANYGQTDERGNVNYNVKSRILKFASERFIPFQSLETFGAFQIVVVNDGSKFLLIFGELNGIRIFQYNGWKFIETFKLRLGEGANLPHSFKLSSFIYESQPYLTIASHNKNIIGGIYNLEFEPKGHNKLTYDMEKWCLAKLVQVKSINVSELVEHVDKAPKLTDPEVMLFSSLTFTNKLHVRQLSTKELTYDRRKFDAQLSKELADRERRLNKLAQATVDISIQLSQVVTKDTSQFINRPIRFEYLDIVGRRFQVDRVTTAYLNGIKVKDLIDNAIHLNKDYTFNRAYINEVIAKGQTEIRNLNGQPLDSYALKSSRTPQTFTKVNTFETEVTAIKGFETEGLVDYINFNEIDFLLTNGNQTFKTLNLHDSTANNLMADFINGVDAKGFMEQVVPISGPANITGRKDFDYINIKNWSGVRRLGIFLLERIFAGALPLRAHSTVFDGLETQFESLSTKSIQVADGYINATDRRVNIESELVSISSGSYYFDSMVLLKDTFVEELSVTNSLNELEVKYGSLGLILKSVKTLQKIQNKALNAIVLEKDSFADGLVDGVKLDGWKSSLEIELTDNHLNLNQFKTNGSLTVDGGIYIDPFKTFYQGENDIGYILRSGLRLDARKLPPGFRSKLIFDSVQVDGDTKVLGTVNGLRTSQWLLRDHGETVLISATKTFQDELSLLAPSTAQQLFATRDRYASDILKDLDDLLIDGMNQTVARSSTFSGLLLVDNLYCPNLVLNRIPFQDLMLKSGDQEIQGRSTFLQEVKINNVFQIDGDLSVEAINGRNLSAAILDTLRTYSSTPQIITGKRSFEKLVVENLIVTGTIGGYNATELLSNIIRNDSWALSKINGSVIFASQAKFKLLDFTGTMNGIESHEWGSGLLTKSGDQIISTPTTFRYSLNAENVKVESNIISNFNIMEFVATVLNIDDGGQLGTVYSDEGVISVDSLRTGSGATVNGYNLNTDVLLKDHARAQIVTGNKRFKNNVTIRGNLGVKYLAGFLYEQAAKFAFGLTDPYDNLRINADLKLRDEPFFKDSFNEKLWSEIIAGIWWNGEDTTIYSPIEFTNGIILENGGYLDKLLNNVNLAELSRDYLSSSKDQIISGGPIIFNRGVTFESLRVNNISVLDGLVNGVDLEEFRDSVILDGVDQSFKSKMLFQSLHLQNVLIEFDARVNGIDLDVDAMTIHGDNVVPKSGKLVFDNLFVEELYLDNGTLLDGIDLTKWSNSAAKIYDNDVTTIVSQVNFKNATFAKGVIVHGFVNGRKYTRQNIFTLSGNQTVDGFYSFTNGDEFSAPKGIIVDGLFNGINLEEAIKPLVRNEGGTEDLIVAGFKKFNEPLVAESVKAEGLYQGDNLDRIIDDIEGRTHIPPTRYNYSLEEKYLELTRTADYLNGISSHLAVFFEYFEWTSLIRTLRTTSLKSVKAFSIGPLPKIALISQTSLFTQTVSWRSYDETTDRYQHDSIPHLEVTGIIKGLAKLQRRDQHFIFMSVVSVGNQPVTIWNTTIAPKAEYVGFGNPEKLSRAFLLQLDRIGEASFSFSITQMFQSDEFGDSAAFLQLTSADRFPRQCVASIVKTRESSSVMVNCFPIAEIPNGNKMNYIQSLLAENPFLISTVAITIGNEKNFILIANYGKDSAGVVDVWGYDRGEDKFMKEHCIPAVNLVSMDASKQFGRHVFLALASGYVKGSHSFGHVYIYRYSSSKKQFVKKQSIVVDDPLQVRFQQLEVSNEIFLYILKNSINRNLLVYVFRGLAGWSLEHTLTVEKGQSLETAVFEFNTKFHAQLMVVNEAEVNVFSLEFNGVPYVKRGL